MHTLIVIPTYNESGNIEELTSRILCLQPDIDLLVVDDNSPDGTGRIVEELANKSKKIKVIHRENKNGLGQAYLDGFRYALSQNPPYERIIQMDADFSHSPEYLVDLLQATQRCDLTLGSRYVAGGKTLNWNLVRKLMSYLANEYVRSLLGPQIKDWTTGFRCFRREVLSSIGLERIKSKGYLFQIEVLNCCLRLGYNIQEIPITFLGRKNGRTKLGIFDIFEAVLGLSRIKKRPLNKGK